MKARAVIGANFGDEGKGLAVDWLCRSSAPGVVVRFNGGAQAGHTVVTPDGRRHIFSHVGSGSFLDIPTFLSSYFICNPIVFFRELAELEKVGIRPTVFASPECLVTTFADMILNQRFERRRGAGAHGSVGLGVSETVERSQIERLKITMADLWNRTSRLESVIAEICDKYAEWRTGSKIDEPAMAEAFLKACTLFAEHVNPAGIGQCKDPLFEGAQGLLLDQNNKEFYPHLTRSNTGIQNVRALCKLAGIDDIEPWYVTRTYLTRHGAGPLPGEDASLRYEDKTNVPHEWQGTIRFAPMDWEKLCARCEEDWGGIDYNLLVTHADQHWPEGLTEIASAFSEGERSTDIRRS